MEKLKEIWNKALPIIEKNMLLTPFNTWIKPLVPQSLDEENQTITLATHSDFAINANLLNDRYLMNIENSIEKVAGKYYKVNFVLSSDTSVKETENYKKEDTSHFNEINNYGDNDINLNPKYTFDTFVVGSNNELAYAAALNVANNPGKNYNPLFIYGGSGLGKTHLMHAVGHHVLRNNPYKKVLYVSSELFTTELVNSIQNKTTIEFKNKYRNVDVLMIDDIQFIEKKDRTQEELFHTFNTLYDSNKQIIFSSDRPPKEIETIDKRLQSRFEWSGPVDIQSPDFETRVAILKNKAEMEDIKVTDEMMEILYLIADKISTNIRELEGALNRVIAHSILTNKPLSKSTAREVLTDVFDTSNRQIDLPLIKNTVCSYYGISVSDIDSSKRTKNLAYPRQIAMYLCRELTDLSLPKIGENFGNRDHTTVIHAYDKISKELQNDENLRKTISELKSSILDK